MLKLLQTQAPDFRLQDQDNREHSLADYRGQYILLYFYPKDMTPGCTIEAQGFRDTLNDLKAVNVQVLGVSADTCQSHKKFAQHHHLNFPLLADIDHAVCQTYGVYEEKSMFGNTFFGILRESFLIDPQGVIIKHYQKVNSKHHAQDVFNDVQTLQRPSQE